MRILDLHRVTPNEMRFTIVDGDRATVRFLFVNATATAMETAIAMADNLNHYNEMRDAGFPHDFNIDEHVAGIYRDAARYGTD